MSAMASQITGISVVCSTVGSDADKKSIKTPCHWPCGEFTGDRWIPCTKAGNAENVSIWWRHHDTTLRWVTESNWWPLFISLLNYQYGCMHFWLTMGQFNKAVVVVCLNICMLTSSDGNILSVTGRLRGESTGHQWIPIQRPVTQSMGVFFDVSLHKRMHRQSRCRWFKTSWRSLWCDNDGLGECVIDL